MPTLRQIADRKTIQAYGTSEGAKKAWDSRGRGRKAKPTSANKSRVEITPDKVARFKRLKQQYEALGQELEKAHSKLDDIKDVKSTWGKFMHFLRSVGEWHDAWGNVRDLVLEVGAAVYVAKNLVHAPAIHHALTTAYSQLAPAMHISAFLPQVHLSADRSYQADRSTLRAIVDGKTINGN